MRFASTYDAIRPTYPDAVFDAIESYLSSVAQHPHVLEVGVGTGQATLQMAARGWHVFGVEPGAQLAATARSRLAAHDLVTVTTATFEELTAAIDGELGGTVVKPHEAQLFLARPTR